MTGKKSESGEESEIEPEIETTIGYYKINGKSKKGITSNKKTVYPNTEAGIIASWNAACDSSRTDREKLFDVLAELEDYAQSVAKQKGCKAESTLDKIEIDGVRQPAGSAAEPLSVFKFAFTLEQQIAKVKQSIEHFELYNFDAGDLHRFYLSMTHALDVAFDFRVLALSIHELAILRGEDESYSHKAGNSRQKQMEAVRRFHNLVDRGMKPNLAARWLAPEYGVARTTVVGWVNKPSQKKYTKEIMSGFDST